MKHRVAAVFHGIGTAPGKAWACAETGASGGGVDLLAGCVIYPKRVDTNMSKDPNVSTSKMSITTPSQIRGARAMLNLSQVETARLAGVSVETLKRLEGVRAGVAVGQGVSADALAKVRAALEGAGIIFIAENGEGAGVRLRKAHNGHD